MMRADPPGRVSAEGRTTLSTATRQLLRLREGDGILFRAHGAGMMVQAVDAETIEAAERAPFLDLMEQDLVRDPAGVEKLGRRLAPILGRKADQAGPPGDPWRLYAHPVFARQAHRLFATLARGAAGRPAITLPGAPDAAALAGLRQLMLQRIPANPFRPEFRQPAPSPPGWLRARCADNRFHLLFRADREARAIVYVWIADRTASRPAACAEPHVLFDSICTVTQQGRTLLPLSVRRKLGVERGGRLSFRLHAGVVLVEGSPASLHDPALAPLLQHLAAAEAAEAAQPPPQPDPPRRHTAPPAQDSAAPA